MRQFFPLLIPLLAVPVHGDDEKRRLTIEGVQKWQIRWQAKLRDASIKGKTSLHQKRQSDYEKDREAMNGRAIAGKARFDSINTSEQDGKKTVQVMLRAMTDASRSERALIHAIAQDPEDPFLEKMVRGQLVIYRGELSCPKETVLWEIENCVFTEVKTKKKK
jgi:hypothetical protein